MLRKDYSKCRESFKAIKRTFERDFSRMETMTDRIMKAAAPRGMSKMAEVERYCGIPKRTLTNMGKGHKPNGATLVKICEALDISEEYVLNGDNPSEQLSLLNAAPAKKPAKQDKLRKFVNLLASLDDEDFETVIEYMYFLRSRKG